MSSAIKVCPSCGNRVPDSMTKRRDGETFCTPITCEAWVVTSKFDKATRSWVPVDDDPGPIRLHDCGRFHRPGEPCPNGSTPTGGQP